MSWSRLGQGAALHGCFCLSLSLTVLLVSPARGQFAVVSEPKMPVSGPQDAPPCAGISLSTEPENGSTSAVERTLASRVSLDLGEQTLAELARYLRTRLHLNVVINHRALDDVGLGSDTPIAAVNIEHVQLETALELILKELDLTFVMKDGMLIICTPEEAENELVTHVYMVADLIYPIDRRGAAWADYDTLIEMITSVVEPDTWDDVGGAGAIEPFPVSEALVISQTRGVHRKVCALIVTLRRARDLQGVTPQQLRYGAAGSTPYRRSGRPPASSQSWGAVPSGGFF